MPGLVPGIHVFTDRAEDVDGRDIGERSDAVLRTAMPGHDQSDRQKEFSMSDIRVGHAELLRFFTAVFAAKEMSASDAATVADMLVWANLRGVDSHGAMRLPSYLDQIRKGEFDPKAQPSLRPLMPATFILDGGRAPSRGSKIQAAAHAIGLADQLGVEIGRAHV